MWLAFCESRGMRTGVTVQLSPEDRVRLNALVADRNTPKKHAWRAEIVLLTPDQAAKEPRAVTASEVISRIGPDAAPPKPNQT